ncbi:SRPBCC family protein [Streptomyces sp. NPDC059104]|uniref:SRPBCC family protein n=1 Tax=Streptomyces sp. NPDC059104 TaxID=3346729 RepID=UPI0036B4EF13
MEHQVFVPVPADDLRALLRDPARVARCVPGLQQDADTAAGPLAGRLRVRVGGSTVTYRGALSLTEPEPGRFAAGGEGAEVRGSGTVKFALGLRLIPHEGGTRLEFTAEATVDGRAAAFEPEATATAARRLLDRLAGNLAAAAGPERDARPRPQDPVAEAEEAEGASGADLGAGNGEEGETGPGAGASVFETEVPPPSLDPFAEADFTEAAGADGAPQPADTAAAAGASGAAARPPAEAAHARRTMIGRSAEEVDHAPPRGRYAPVPAPSTVGAAAGMRWIAPAAALALASAVVVGRVLRRRR